MALRPRAGSFDLALWLGFGIAFSCCATASDCMDDVCSSDAGPKEAPVCCHGDSDDKFVEESIEGVTVEPAADAPSLKPLSFEAFDAAAASSPKPTYNSGVSRKDMYLTIKPSGLRPLEVEDGRNSDSLEGEAVDENSDADE